VPAEPQEAGVAGPLSGLNVLEFAGVGPAPFCGMLLSDLGASVTRICRISDVRPAGSPAPAGLAVHTEQTLLRGRRSIAVNIKSAGGLAVTQRLVAGCDALIEGFRPGVMERLGLGPDDCLATNPRLVYGRMTGWGQSGPYARAAGHDINFIGLSGVLSALGHPDHPPLAPLNLLGDFGGGGLLLAFGVLAGLLESARSGHGQVIDASMVSGSALLMTMFYELLGHKSWDSRRGTNVTDGGAPFYATYRTSDDRFVAVGALEDKFFQTLAVQLGLAPEMAADRWNPAQWPAMREELTRAFAGRTRDEWCQLFEGSDACVTPVLTMSEALEHPHNVAAGIFTDVSGTRQPGPSPHFSRTQPARPQPAHAVGIDTGAVLSEAGFSNSEIDDLRNGGAIG
jgi:alpha-methylacyl-CoA racemase